MLGATRMLGVRVENENEGRSVVGGAQIQRNGARLHTRQCSGAIATTNRDAADDGGAILTGTFLRAKRAHRTEWKTAARRLVPHLLCSAVSVRYRAHRIRIFARADAAAEAVDLVVRVRRAAR